MKPLYYSLIMALAMLVPFVLNGQDPHFSQFFANRVYLNPAFAGLDPGTTLSFNYRDQWFGIPDGDIATAGNSFRTYNATLDFQLPCFLNLENLNLGSAFSVFKDAAGDAPLSTTGFGLALSFEKSLEPANKTIKILGYELLRFDWRVGFQYSMMQKRIMGDHFIYSNQLDHIGGLISSPALFESQTNWFPNLNVGVMMRGYIKKSKFKGTLFTAGISLSNVTDPSAFLTNNAGGISIPRRLTVHLGTYHTMPVFKGNAKPIYIAPQFRWDQQAGVSVITAGAFSVTEIYYTGIFFQFNPGGADNPIVESPRNFLSKNTSTIILSAGLDVFKSFDWRKNAPSRSNGLYLGFSYDFNLGGLKSNKTLGVLEFNLRMSFTGSGKRKTIKDCGQMGKNEFFRGGACPVKF